VEQVEHLEHLQAGAIKNADFEGADEAPPTEDAQPGGVSAFGQGEHLGRADGVIGGPDIPAGWSASSWADRLNQLADQCKVVNPALAAEHRRNAAAIRGNQ
jgi:hypothetical protein